MPAQILFRDEPYLKECAATVTAADANGLRLDRTIFYATGGGQPGDTGTLRWADGELKITDTRKYRTEGQPEDILHLVPEGSALPAPGTQVTLTLDWDRRHAHMRMHTCLHLLSALLRDAAVTGGQVGADKGRLDFNIAADQIDKDALTAGLNKLIAENHPVATQWISDEDLLAQPDLVRTMSVKPPMGFGKVRLVKIGDAVDLQPCGGTHVARTGEIGPVEVAKIENKGKQNRRVTVVFKPAA